MKGGEMKERKTEKVTLLLVRRRSSPRSFLQ